MKNRQHYITRKNEHDMMLEIRRNTGCCPIRAVSGIVILPERYGVGCIADMAGCSRCINDWLNREATGNGK